MKVDYLITLSSSVRGMTIVGLGFLGSCVSILKQRFLVDFAGQPSLEIRLMSSGINLEKNLL